MVFIGRGAVLVARSARQEPYNGRVGSFRILVVLRLSHPIKLVCPSTMLHLDTQKVHLARADYRQSRKLPSLLEVTLNQKVRSNKLLSWIGVGLELEIHARI